MTYARALQERFPDLKPRVDDLLLLEAHQIAGMPDRAPARELAAVLHAHPRIADFFISRHPPVGLFLKRLLAETDPAGTQDLAGCEQALL